MIRASGREVTRRKDGLREEYGQEITRRKKGQSKKLARGATPGKNLHFTVVWYCNSTSKFVDLDGISGPHPRCIVSVALGGLGTRHFRVTLTPGTPNCNENPQKLTIGVFGNSTTANPRLAAAHGARQEPPLGDVLTEAVAPPAASRLPARC